MIFLKKSQFSRFFAPQWKKLQAQGDLQHRKGKLVFFISLAFSCWKKREKGKRRPTTIVEASKHHFTSPSRIFVEQGFKIPTNQVNLPFTGMYICIPLFLLSFPWIIYMFLHVCLHFSLPRFFFCHFDNDFHAHKYEKQPQCKEFFQ